MQNRVMRIPSKSLVCIVLFVVNGYLLLAQQPSASLSSSVLVHISKIRDNITLDGELNDSIWANRSETSNANNWYGRFVQYYPYDTSQALTQTAFKLAYSDKYLYIALYCANRNPKTPFVLNGLKRDFSVTNTDAAVVTLSTYQDGQNGFSFGLSPYNTQREGAVENGGGFGVSTSWDQVWFSKTHLYDSCWTAELKIPFNSIRFIAGQQQWGINVSRIDLKNNEISNFARVPRNFNISTLVFTQPAQFDKPLHTNAKFNTALIPYLAGNALQENANAEAAVNPKLGLDAKLGLSRSLNLDLTFNPDFAQVDVDVQQINLTRFSLFFPERRQFFLENSDLFSSFGFRQIRPFFSRRIGLSESGAVPILAGARLSGKVGTNLRVGFMNVTTGAIRNQKPVNYTVAALQKKIFAASTIGAIAVQDQILDSAGDYNAVLGAEYNLLSANNKWGGKAFIQKSHYPQISYSRGFAHASWLRYRDLNWFIMWNHEYVSRFYKARTGFVPRIANFDTSGQIQFFDYWRLEPEIKRTWYPKHSKRINNMSVMIYNSSYYDSLYQINESESELGFDLAFQNSALWHISLDHSFQRLFIPFKPFDQLSAFYGSYNWWALHSEISTNNRKAFYLTSECSIGGYFTGQKTEISWEGFYRVPAIGKSKLPKWVISANGNRIVINAKGVSNAVNLFGFKVEHSFSTLCYLTGFLQYNSQAQRTNINVRFQWRYRPMSDIFIVLAQNWNTIAAPGTEFWNWNMQTRSVSLKWVYWFNS